MDLVVGKRWFDVTITIDELKRFRQKEKTYGQAAKEAGAKLKVLAFNEHGHILKRSLGAARELAKLTGAPLAEFFAEAAAHVASASAMARVKAVDWLQSLWSASVMLPKATEDRGEQDPESETESESDSCFLTSGTASRASSSE